MKKYLLALILCCCSKEEPKSIRHDNRGRTSYPHHRRKLTSTNDYTYIYNYNLKSKTDPSQFLSVDQNDYLVTTTIFDNNIHLSKRNSDNNIIWERTYLLDHTDVVGLHPELRYLSNGNYILLTKYSNSISILEINSITGEMDSSYIINYNQENIPSSFIVDNDTIIMTSTSNSTINILTIDYLHEDKKATIHKYEQGGRAFNPYIVKNDKLNGYMMGYGNNDDKYSFQFIHLNNSFYPIWKKDISTQEDIFFKSLFNIDHTNYLAIGDIINIDTDHKYGTIMLIDENAIVRRKQQIKVDSHSNSLTKYLYQLPHGEYLLLGSLYSNDNIHHPYTINVYNNGSLGQIVKYDINHAPLSMAAIGDEVVISMKVDKNKYQIFNRYLDIDFSCITTSSLQRTDVDLTNQFDLSSNYDIKYSNDMIEISTIEYMPSNNSIMSDYICN